MRCEPLKPGEKVASHKLVEDTVGAIQGTCPGGVVGPTGSVTGYSVKPPLVGVKRQLGALRTRKDLVERPGRHVAEWVATALSQLNEKDLGDPKTAGALAVAQLPIGDVLYLVLGVKLFANDDGLPLPNGVCRNCGHELTGMRMAASELEVLRWPRSAEEGGPVSTANPALVRVGLKHGVEVMPGVRAFTLLLKSPTWAEVMWGLPGPSWSNPVDIAIATIRGAAIGCEVEGAPLCSGARLTMDQVEGMHEADLELAEEAVSDLSARAIYMCEIECPECKHPHIAGVDWKDAVFS